MKTIAFQGKPGAYSEMTIHEHFPSNDYQSKGFPLSEEVFEAVLSNRCELGLLPIENSIVGNVNVNIDLFFKENVFVLQEFYLSIRHCLLGIPGSSLEQIKRVYSHPIALAQCKNFFRTHNIKINSEYDTAGSCLAITKDPNPKIGAVASELCAEIYGLNVLKRNIQDFNNNYTRFFLFQKGSPERQLKQEKTSIAFVCKHHPGALLNCLKIFADHNLNLTKLQSRPIPENPFAYIFYTDFLGGIQEKNVQDCFNELQSQVNQLKIIGSYAQGKRQSME